MALDVSALGFDVVHALNLAALGFNVVLVALGFNVVLVALGLSALVSDVTTVDGVALGLSALVSDVTTSSMASACTAGGSYFPHKKAFLTSTIVTPSLKRLRMTSSHMGLSARSKPMLYINLRFSASAYEVGDDELLSEFNESEKDLINVKAMECHSNMNKNKDMFAINTGTYFPSRTLAETIMTSKVKGNIKQTRQTRQVLQEHHGDIFGVLLSNYQYIRVKDEKGYRIMRASEIGEYDQKQYHSANQKKMNKLYFSNTVIWKGSDSDVRSVEKHLQNIKFPLDPNSFHVNRHRGGTASTTTGSVEKAVSFVTFHGLLEAVRNGDVYFCGENPVFVKKMTEGRTWLKDDKYWVTKGEEWVSGNIFGDGEGKSENANGGKSEE